ncbi:MAG: DUF6056 family protein [Xenococcus sp. MO_188.B8]|nr:DUF6056 family protein [Xenococcus sp. MO_188.B8]
MANSLFIISVGIIINTLYLEKDKYSILFFINLLLIPLINGLSETVMVTYSTFILLISSLNLTLTPFNKKFLLKNIMYLAITIISACAVYLAPGNSTRFEKVASKSLSDTTRQLLFSFKNAFLSSIHHIWTYINPFWICLFLLLLFIVSKFPCNQLTAFFKSKKVLGIVITSLAACFYMSYFVRWYSLGTIGPLRAESTSYIVFFMITIIIGLYFGLSLNSNQLFKYLKNQRIFLSLVTIFCFLSIIVNNKMLIKEFWLLKSHYKYYQNIYPLVINTKSGSDIKLPPEPRVKILRRDVYLSKDKQFWINKYFSRYFKLNSVSISSEIIQK